MTQRLRGLDTLRAIAILMVVCHHWMSGTPVFNDIAQLGWAGVDLFFVLSGSLIGGQLFKELRQTGHIGLRTFFLKRALRTLPSYYVVIGILAIVQPIGGVVKPLWHYIIFIQNYFPLYNFSASWSLCIEEQFYLVLPLVTMAIFFGGRTLKLTALARTTSIIVFFVAALGLQWTLRTGIWTSNISPYLTSAQLPIAVQNFLSLVYFRTHTHLDGLLIGVFIAVFQNVWSATWLRVSRWHHVMFWIGMFVVGLAFFLSIERYSFAATTYGLFCFAVGFGLVTMSQYMKPDSSFYFPGAKTIATLSYSIYLVHAAVLPPIQVLIAKASLNHPYVWLVVSNLCATVFFAIALYYFIERPSLDLRQRLLRREVRTAIPSK